MDKKTFKYILILVVFAVVLSVILFNAQYVFMYLNNVFNIMSPIILGVVFAFVLNIPMRKLEGNFNKSKNKLIRKISRPISLMISVLIILLILTAIVVLVLPPFFSAVSSLGEYMQSLYNESVTWIKGLDYPQDDVQNLLDNFNVNWESIGNQAVDFFKNAFPNMIETTFNFVFALFNTTINVALAFVIAIYILLGKEKLKYQLKRVVLATFNAKISLKLIKVLKLCNYTFSKYLTGQIIEAFILGILCFLGMLLFMFPNAAMISALIGIFALIPLVGAYLGCFLGAFMILMENPIQAVFFIVFFIVLQQIEGNFIYPKVVGNSVGISPIWVLIAIIIGGGLLGFTGLFFAVPAMSVIYQLVKESTNEKLKNKPVL